jgi:hypothetical protein
VTGGDSGPNTLLAEAFERVDHPILRMHIRRRAIVHGKLRRRIFGRPTRRERSGLLKARRPTICVPQDFDLSPYFDVVKFNAREPVEFEWVREE